MGFNPRKRAGRDIGTAWHGALSAYTLRHDRGGTSTDILRPRRRAEGGTIEVSCLDIRADTFQSARGGPHE